VSFNFKEPSSTLDGIRANRFFTIHFLNSDVNGANVATHFLQHPGDHYASWKALSVDHELSVSKQLNLLAPRQNAPQTPVAPIIRGPGIAAHITCEILPDKCITKIGDHSIIVAKVVTGPLQSKNDPYARKRLDDGIAPLLLYSEGHFREHGNKIATNIAAADTRGESNEQEAATHEHFHADMINRRAVITAGEPKLYRAASAYIGLVLDKPSYGSYFEQMSKFSKFMLSSADRRARFVAALKLWHFEQSVARGAPNVSILNVPVETLPETDQEAFITRDQRFAEIAEELVNVAISGDRAGSLRGAQGGKVPTVKPRYTPSTPRTTDRQDHVASREMQSDTPELRITRTPSSVSPTAHQAITRLRSKRSTASSRKSARLEEMSEDSKTGDFHASVGDALRQAELELKKHEKTQRNAADDKAKPEVTLPGPSFSDFHA
jgi:flavin reductase (DIM6/NTAB) family NADH-FMN oxidoreductase RutF